MTRVCVIINDIGGVPHTLHRNVAAHHRVWAETSHVGLPLPSTDRAEGFRCVSRGTSKESIFSVVSSRNVSTVLCGPSCGMRRLPDAQSLHDPEHALSHMGVERCSPYDDASFVGRSDVYDVDTLRYATDVLAHHTEGPLLLWVNLLALRDVDRVHPSTAMRNSRVDRRSFPESLHNVIPTVTEEVVQHFYVGDAPRFMVRHSEVEFSSLLEHSIDALERHTERVRKFVLCTLEHLPDAHICHTASHSLAIGEHGMRGGGTPMSTTCTTFASMRPETVVTKNLDTTLCNFVLDAFKMSHPSDPGTPTTRVPSLSMTRTLVTIHDHEYAVIEQNGTLLSVFDLSTDPFELNDVSGSVGHLRSALRQHAMRDAVGAVPEESTAPTPRGATPSPLVTQRPHPVSLPSPSPSDVSSASTAHAVARQDSFTRRVPRPTASSSSSHASQNVRRTEQRLHTLHR